MDGTRVARRVLVLIALSLVLGLAAAAPVLAADYEVPAASDAGLAFPLAELVEPAQALSSASVLWDQPLSTVNNVTVRTQDYGPSGYYMSDDFINAVAWDIEAIYVPGDGWSGFTTLLNATQLNWRIYADNGGRPAGDPEGGGSAPIWSLSLAPSDPQLQITNGSKYGLPSNTLLTLSEPLTLPAGHWWLVMYATLPSSAGAFGQHPSDTANGYPAHWTQPGVTPWQDWGPHFGYAQHDFAFRLEGQEADVRSLKENAVAELDALASTLTNRVQRTIVSAAAACVLGGRLSPEQAAGIAGLLLGDRCRRQAQHIDQVPPRRSGPCEPGDRCPGRSRPDARFNGYRRRRGGPWRSLVDMSRPEVAEPRRLVRARASPSWP